MAELVLLVRVKSPLTREQVLEIADSRADEFRALEGLKQKYYLHDANTGEYAGLYFWDGQEPLNAYRESELRASIASAYQAQGQPSVEVFSVIKVLRE